MTVTETVMSLADLVASDDDELRNLPIEWIFPSASQQRKHFSKEKIQALAVSIKQIGIRVPLEVKEISSDKRYEIISGERRYRAAKEAGLDILPTIIRKKVHNHVATETQFAENIHREDLNAVEKALAIVQLMEIEGYNQKKAGEICGKSEAWVSKQLKILEQPVKIQSLAKEGLLRDLNTLYEISNLPEKEMDEIIKLIRADNFNYKLYKSNKQETDSNSDENNETDGNAEIKTAKKQEFKFSKDEFKKIIKLISLHPNAKKKFPHWQKIKDTDLPKVLEELKKWTPT